MAERQPRVEAHHVEVPMQAAVLEAVVEHDEVGARGYEPRARGDAVGRR